MHVYLFQPAPLPPLLYPLPCLLPLLPSLPIPLLPPCPHHLLITWPPPLPFLALPPPVLPPTLLPLSLPSAPHSAPQASSSPFPLSPSPLPPLQPLPPALQSPFLPPTSYLLPPFLLPHRTPTLFYTPVVPPPATLQPDSNYSWTGAVLYIGLISGARIRSCFNICRDVLLAPSCTHSLYVVCNEVLRKKTFPHRLVRQ